MTNTQPKTSDSPFVFRIERTFDVSRTRMWKAWTDSAEFTKWFGPKGCEMIYSEIDLRAGGRSAYGMRFAGQEMYGQWAYQEIVAPEKIVAIVSFLDKDGNKIHHPMKTDWPMDIWSVVTFTEEGGKTKIRVEWTAHNPSAAEQKAFNEEAPGMGQGWGGTFERLEDYLAKG